MKMHPLLYIIVGAVLLGLAWADGECSGSAMAISLAILFSGAAITKAILEVKR